MYFIWCWDLSVGVVRAKLWLLNTKSYQRSTRTWCFLSLTATKTTRCVNFFFILFFFTCFLSRNTELLIAASGTGARD